MSAATSNSPQTAPPTTTAEAPVAAAAWTPAHSYWPQYNYDPRQNYYPYNYGGQPNAQQQQQYPAPQTYSAQQPSYAGSTPQTKAPENKASTLWTPPVHQRPKNEAEVVAANSAMSKSPGLPASGFEASANKGPPIGSAPPPQGSYGSANGHVAPPKDAYAARAPPGGYNASSMSANPSHYGGYYSPHYMPMMRPGYQKGSFPPRQAPPQMARNCYSGYYNGSQQQQQLGYNGQQTASTNVSSPSPMGGAPVNATPLSGSPVCATSSSSSAGLLPPSTSTSSVHGDNLSLHDESSQQSTLSQSSDRSDGRQTPKTNSSSGYLSSGNNGNGSCPQQQVYPPSHMAPPSYSQSYSFGASPEFSHWQQTRGSMLAKSSNKADGLGRLYEMDAHPDRRYFLDRLLFFMEQRGSPIQQCPTISKNPLDLFKLYCYTKERGGYAECSKSKTWKDIAARLGIGASSSAAYTLKKHYGKTLLPFECHFDRGGIDPAPLLAIGEAPAKKKANKSAQNESFSGSQHGSLYHDSYISGQSASPSDMDMKRSYFMNQQQMVNRSPSPSKLDYQSSGATNASPSGAWGPYGSPYGPQNGNSLMSLDRGGTWRNDSPSRANGPQTMVNNRPSNGSPYTARPHQMSGKPMSSTSFSGQRPSFSGGYSSWASSSGLPPRGPLDQQQWANSRGRPIGPWPHDPAMYQTPGSWYRPGMRPDWAHRPPMHHRSFHSSSLRRAEVAFPPGSVEATPPLLCKRQRYTKLDVQPIDPWQVVMALKSGLLCESTWALDVLNILLFDDNAIQYFALSNLKGLLQPLLEHLVRIMETVYEEDTLDDIVDVSEDDEMKNRMVSQAPTNCFGQRLDLKRRKVETRVEGDDDDFDLGQPSLLLNALTGQSTRVYRAIDSKKRGRFDQEIEVSEKKAGYHVLDGRRRWDTSPENCNDADSELWRQGSKVHTRHIVLPLNPDPGNAVFIGRPSENSKDETPKEKDLRECDAVDALVGKDVKEEPSVLGRNEEGADDFEEIKKCEEEKQEDIVDRIRRETGIELTNAMAARQRAEQCKEEEDDADPDEVESEDASCLQLVTENEDSLERRLVAILIVLRNLSFVPGNESELSRNATLLRVAGKILSMRRPFSRTDQASKSFGEAVLENILVMLSNIAGALDLRPYDEGLIRPLLHGLLWWASSSSIAAQDAFSSTSLSSFLSPQRLALEALCKLCVHEHNVDLLLATPPFARLRRLVRLLTKRLSRNEDQVLRELSINLLHYLIAADPSVCEDQLQIVVQSLVCFVEQAEQNALLVAQQHGVNALRDNPESMGTSLDMLRRAASTLSHLCRDKINLDAFVGVEERLLALVMSQILDQGVAAVLSNVLFEIGKLPLNSPNTPIATSTKDDSKGERGMCSEESKSEGIKEESKEVEYGNQTESRTDTTLS